MRQTYQSTRRMDTTSMATWKSLMAANSASAKSVNSLPAVRVPSTRSLRPTSRIILRGQSCHVIDASARQPDGTHV